MASLMGVMDLSLDAAAYVTLDNNGDGVASIGPRHPGVTWRVTKAAVSTDTNDLIPNCRLYLGTVSPGSLLDGTVNGSQDSTDLDITLECGESLTAHWTAGDPGRRATLSVFGIKTVRTWR
jgi:hypothetical protein